jgi:hypothetical protein
VAGNAAKRGDGAVVGVEVADFEHFKVATGQ